MDINWEIIETPENTLGKVKIMTEPRNDIIEHFYSGIDILRFPAFVKNRVNSVGFHNEVTGIISHSSLDGGDIAEGRGFETGNIKLYHNAFHEEFLINEIIFDKMTIDYSTKLLEAYFSSNEVNDAWKNEMSSMIEELKLKIKNQS